MTPSSLITTSRSRGPACPGRSRTVALRSLPVLAALLLAAGACTTTETASYPDICFECAMQDALSGWLDANQPGAPDTASGDTGRVPDVRPDIVEPVDVVDDTSASEIVASDVVDATPDVAPDVEEDTFVRDVRDEEDVVDTVAPPPDVPPVVDVPVDTGSTVEPLAIALAFSDEALSGLVTVEPIVTGGERVIGVEFYVDDVRLDTDLIPPYNFVLNTSQWLDGPHRIAVTTADSRGQTASASANVVFDNTPPVFTELRPADGVGIFFEDGPLRMRAESEDNDTLTRVEFRANGLLVGQFTEPPFEAEIPWESLFVSQEDLPANVFVQFNARDVLGQTTEVTYTVTVHQRMLWSFPTLGEIRAEAALLPNGNIVIGNAIAGAGGGSLPSKLYAITPDGEEAWVGDVPAAINWAAVYHEGTNRIYVSGDDGNLYTFSTSGVPGPTKDLQQVLGGKVRVVGDSIYAVSYDGVLWVLNVNNLDVRWTHNLPGNVLSVPAVGADGTVYVSCFDGRLYAVNSGGVVWSKETGGEVRSSPGVGADGTVYFGSNDGYVYAVAPDGSERWSTEVTGFLQSEILVGQEGAVYVASSSKFLSRLDPETGDEVWATRVGGVSLSAPRQGSDGTIYGGTTGGTVYAVAPDDGELLWNVQVTPEVREIRGTVLVTDERVYVGSTDRSFYALRLVPPEVEQ